MLSTLADTANYFFSVRQLLREAKQGRVTPAGHYFDCTEGLGAQINTISAWCKTARRMRVRHQCVRPHKYFINTNTIYIHTHVYVYISCICYIQISYTLKACKHFCFVVALCTWLIHKIDSLTISDHLE